MTQDEGTSYTTKDELVLDNSRQEHRPDMSDLKIINIEIRGYRDQAR